MKQVRSRYVSLMLATVLVGAVSLGAVFLAEAKETVTIALPASGRLRDVEGQLVGKLRSRGLEVVEAPAQQLPQPVPTSLITDDDSIGEARWQQTLAKFIREGGGVVLIVGRGPRHIQQANAFVEPLGLEIVTDRQVRGDLAFHSSPLTAGLSPPALGSLRMRLVGDHLVPVASQGGRLVCGGVVVGEGGLVVIPDQLVLADSDQAPDQGSGIALLTRLVCWASRLAELRTTATAGLPQPEGERAVLVGRPDIPLEQRDFTDAILYDCQAVEDNWPEITAVVVDALKTTDLPVKALRVEGVDEPLLVALRSRPELVVLGSWRQYSVAEQALVYQYVASGGRLLALANVHTDRQIRLVHLNELLIQFGAVCSLGRPGGSAEIAAGPRRELGDISWGIGIIGSEIQPLITVKEGRYIAAGRLQFANGRIVAMDAEPLVENAAYRLQLKEHLLPWLLSGE